MGEMLREISPSQFDWWYVFYLKHPWGFGDEVAAKMLACWSESKPGDHIPMFLPDDEEETDAAAAQVAAIRSRALSQKVD